MVVRVKAISLKALIFYLWHRKKLRNPSTLAYAFWKSDNGSIIGIHNILQSIQAIFDGVEVNRGRETHSNNPLLILQKGDIVYCVTDAFASVWNYTSRGLEYSQIQSW